MQHESLTCHFEHSFTQVRTDEKAVLTLQFVQKRLDERNSTCGFFIQQDSKHTFHLQIQSHRYCPTSGFVHAQKIR